MSADARTDRELVAAALEGRRPAQRELADRLLDSIKREVAIVLTRLAASRGRDPAQEVRDMVQEVLVSLFERDGQELKRWDPERGRSLDSFVRLVARRRVARILAQRRGNPWADNPVDPVDIGGDDDAEAARRLETRDELSRVLVALYANLSERDHELFELLFVQQLDPDEVAKALGISRGAVNASSYRMRKLARRLCDAPTSSEDDTLSKDVVDHG